MTKKYSKRKKTLLTLGASLLPVAVPLLVEGSYIEGGILFGIAAVMIAAYDHLNAKGESVEVPESIDKKTFEEVAEVAAEQIETATDSYSDSN